MTLWKEKSGILMKKFSMNLKIRKMKFMNKRIKRKS